MKKNDQLLPGCQVTNRRTQHSMSLCFFLLAGVVAASLVLQGSKPDTNWFMRSGAIVVLIGAVMEYRHNGFMRNADIESIRWASGVGGPVIFEQPMFRKVFGYLAHVCVVVGTFIAAYGDLIYAKFFVTIGL